MGLSKVSTCAFPVSKLIVGLGNPTILFDNTRHNIGKTFIDLIARKNSVSFEKIKGGEITYLKQNNELNYVALFKPGSFMNVSGGPVKNAMSFCKLDNVNDLIVVADDLEQTIGKVRIKEGGSAQGHNGVKSIIDVYGGKKEFKRVLIGIGRPVSKDQSEVALYVNSKMPEDERKIFKDSTIGKIIELIKKSTQIQL